MWTQPFGRLLLQQVAPLGKATILDVMCHTGYPGLELLRRFPEARVFAVDPSSALLEVARKKAGAHANRRIYFKTEPSEPRLPYDEGAFDLVISNLGLHDVAQPRLLLREMARVAKPGAQVLCTLPLRGTFAEFYTLLEALCEDRVKNADNAGDAGAAARLRAHLATWPEASAVLGWAAEAGLVELELLCAPFSLLIAGGADLFFAPVFEYGPLTAWKTILGGAGPQMQKGFAELKDAIDRICRGEGKSARTGRPEHASLRALPFSLTVRAACLRARRPLPYGPSEPGPAAPGTDAAATGSPASGRPQVAK
ncbi:class I SAM-dependent methyltransferase [Haliangium sp. UPWRP_2]|uniref:class I SAM-dependent methyltransferase n=1 Tax=Haliangium sp. UPWRP_2 TaxID=1931276 RepID=UPI001E342619|nr:class I SAM-dependent methyltransferase [Haliangium sp. UPWRP_2]